MALCSLSTGRIGDAAAPRRLGDDAAGHDQDFLVRERDRLAALDRREHRLERRRCRTRRTGRGRRRDATPPRPARRGRSPATVTPRRQPRRSRSSAAPDRHRHDARPIARDLLGQQLGVLACREADDLSRSAMRVDHGQRALADRAGRSENGDAFHDQSLQRTSDLQLTVDVASARRSRPARQTAARRCDRARRRGRNQRRAVLHAGAALQHRLEQIAGDARAPRRATPSSARSGDRHRRQPPGAGDGQQHGAEHEPADAPLRPSSSG